MKSSSGVHKDHSDVNMCFVGSFLLARKSERSSLSQEYGGCIPSSFFLTPLPSSLLPLLLPADFHSPPG